MMWNWRMLAASGDAKFTDVMERALYNGINSGMSLDGKLYCYRNPLAFDPSTGDKIRNPWYDTTCCPPNLERTFASLPGYFYSTSADGVYVHFYDNSELQLAARERRQALDQANHAVSMGGHGASGGYAGFSPGVHVVRAHSRMVKAKYRQGEWQPGGRRCARGVPAAQASLVGAATWWS